MQNHNLNYGFPTVFGRELYSEFKNFVHPLLPTVLRDGIICSKRCATDYKQFAPIWEQRLAELGGLDAAQKPVMDRTGKLQRVWSDDA